MLPSRIYSCSDILVGATGTNLIVVKLLNIGEDRKEKLLAL